MSADKCRLDYAGRCSNPDHQFQHTKPSSDDAERAWRCPECGRFMSVVCSVDGNQDEDRVEKAILAAARTEDEALIGECERVLGELHRDGWTDDLDGIVFGKTKALLARLSQRREK